MNHPYVNSWFIPRTKEPTPGNSRIELLELLFHIPDKFPPKPPLIKNQARFPDSRRGKSSFNRFKPLDCLDQAWNTLIAE